VAAHEEEAFLDDLTVFHGVETDLVHVRALTALRRHVHLEAHDELIAVHIGTLDLEIVHGVVCVPLRAFAFDRFATFEFRHVAGHRLAADNVVGPVFFAGGVKLAFAAHLGERFRKILRAHENASERDNTLPKCRVHGSGAL
jgi:hypothetical protein